jgi:hypothetical protein
VSLLFVSKSIAVNYAAYNCHWYKHSMRVKKLLQMVIMRSQIPAQLTAGKFYTVSLRTFSEVRKV